MGGMDQLHYNQLSTWPHRHWWAQRRYIFGEKMWEATCFFAQIRRWVEVVSESQMSGCAHTLCCLWRWNADHHLRTPPRSTEEWGLCHWTESLKSYTKFLALVSEGSKTILAVQYSFEALMFRELRSQICPKVPILIKNMSLGEEYFCGRRLPWV